MLTSGQQRAVDLIAAGANVFLTGEGGTGKSFAISKAVSRLMAMGKDVLLCAPTGVAAQNIGGSTIHSAFGFDFAPKVADAMDGLRPTKVISASDAIIIDEVGMVRRDLMDAIARVVEIENEARRDEKQAARRLKNGSRPGPSRSSRSETSRSSRPSRRAETSPPSKPSTASGRLSTRSPRADGASWDLPR